MLAILLVAFSGTAEAQPPPRQAVHHRVAAAPPGPVPPPVGVGPRPPAYKPPHHVGFHGRPGYYYVGAISSPVSWESVAPAPAPAVREEKHSGMVWIQGNYDEDGKWIDGRWMDERDAAVYKRGPPGKTQMIEIPYDDSGRPGKPIVVEEEDPSEPAELHAPPPDR